jgi:hypothetical protein
VKKILVIADLDAVIHMTPDDIEQELEWPALLEEILWDIEDEIETLIKKHGFSPDDDEGYDAWYSKAMPEFEVIRNKAIQRLKAMLIGELLDDDEATTNAQGC